MFGWFKLASRKKRQRRRALLHMHDAAMELLGAVSSGESMDMKTEWANVPLEYSISFLVAILSSMLLRNNFALDSDALRKLMVAIEEKIEEARLAADIQERIEAIKDRVRRRCDG